LTSFNNVYIISFEKLHKEAVDNKVNLRDNKSDFTSGHASKPYINEGKHLDNNCNTTSSFATLPTFPKIAFAER